MSNTRIINIDGKRELIVNYDDALTLAASLQFTIMQHEEIAKTNAATADYVESMRRLLALCMTVMDDEQRQRFEPPMEGRR